MADGEHGWLTDEGFVARPHEPARLPEPPTGVVFSLFEGDLVNRLFASIGLHGRRAGDLIWRSLILVGLTWGVLAFLAVVVSRVARGPAGENFFLDFAAYLQLVIGLPLFVIAERVIGEHTREAAGYFLTAGVVPASDEPTVEALHRRVERLRKSLLPDLGCAVLGLALGVATILPELSSTCPSWHTSLVAADRSQRVTGDELNRARRAERAACDELKAEAKRRKTGEKEPNAPDKDARAVSPEPKRAGELPSEPPAVRKEVNWAGRWEMIVALPLLNYWWLRWIWKIGLWSWYLFRLSRLPLVLTPTHPDATGGIGFISDVQTKFGLAILAYGVSNIASTVGYKIGVEQASWALPSVWGPLLGYVVGAPLLFTLPLFMFTKQLYRVKKRAREELYGKSGERARAFDARWRKAEPSARLNADLMEWHQLRSLYEHVEKMRIVPFDLRSFAELLGQTLGALVPLLGYLNLPEPLLNVIEHGSKMFK